SIDTVNGVSSSTIVPVPVAVPRLAPTGFVSVAVNVSSPSYSASPTVGTARSAEHTSALQSRDNLVCRLLPAKDVAVPSPVPSLSLPAFSHAPATITIYTPSLHDALPILSIDTVNGVSSSTIVPVPVAVPRLAPTGFVSVAVNVSSPSYSASPTVGTATGTLVLPAGTVTNNPDCAV